MSGPDVDDISTIEEEEDVRKGGQSDASVSPKPARAAFDHGLPPVGGPAVDERSERRTTKSRCARCGDALERCLDKIPFPQIRPLKCLQQPGSMNRCFESNSCCRCCGSRGCQVFGNLRKILLFVSLCLTLVSIALRAMPAAALSSDMGNLHGFPWAYGSYECIRNDLCEGLTAQVYIGLEAILVDSENFNIYKVIQWSADDCEENLSSLGAGEYCSICDRASKGCAAMAFVSIATGLVNIWTDIQRMRSRNDHNCIKSVAIGSNVLGALALCLAVSIFHGLCVSEFPLEDSEQTYKIDLALGTGGALVASASTLNFFNIVIHWLVPVPEAHWKTTGKIDDDPAPNEWPSVRGKGVASVEDVSCVMPFDGAGTLAGVPR